ncbi:Flp family type IVb pilin [Sansalvadorimonas sp. 2012CJ34-2]|uniref:Flp family type IVb pilin n=1 Tax=Parendozoicomonas callyspongiae TaxID=2942213 RepID=A0ABT0PLX2_9GAMM|nr:Flp family type IVb pilin [Sansalvadorimonas sp. 2012CJ34-2]MCL6271453.1 Flp family type IVb pilin [Sansalvadorimonas sp. 2012CJ34-2]
MFTKLYVKGQLLLDQLKNDERGVTAIEYAIVAVAIAGTVALVFTGDNTTGLGKALEAAMTSLTTQLTK